jgi:hypothetical protein
MAALPREVEIATAIGTRKLNAIVLQPADAVGPLPYNLRNGIRMTKACARIERIRVM